MRKAEFWLILVVGGSPCQGNSVLNGHRSGMADQCTRLFAHVRRIYDAESILLGTARLAVLENVQNAPAGFVKASAQFSVGPLLTNAGGVVGSQLC